MLLDHFRPPLSDRRPWSGFLSHWASTLGVDLNRQLPEGWFAEPNVQWSVEIDVGAFEDMARMVPVPSAQTRWQPPVPDRTIDFDLRTDVVEVRVYQESAAQLAGVVEIVSPVNKDRPESREAFVSKCDTFLRDAVGLALIDVVTSRTANLHALLTTRFGLAASGDDRLYAAAYRPRAVGRTGHVVPAAGGGPAAAVAAAVPEERPRRAARPGGDLPTGLPRPEDRPVGECSETVQRVIPTQAGS